jgi:hypothetical protein
VHMAHQREIDLSLPDPEKGDEAAQILTTITERFVTFEQHMDERFERLTVQTQAMISHLRYDMEYMTAQLEQVETRQTAVQDERQHTRTSASPQNRPTAPAPRARNGAAASTPPPKPTAKKRGKRKAKARKLLPGTLTPLATFRQLHHISEKVVGIAVQRNKLAVVRGAWVYEHHPISVALDQQGQQQFHALFHGREDFQQCQGCPHAL